MEKEEGGKESREQAVLRPAVCVAMVHAQSELHSSFAAQLANYHRLHFWYEGDQKLSGFLRAFLFDLHIDTALYESKVKMYFSQMCMK